MTTNKVYVDTEDLSREELEQLLIDKDKENKRLQSALDYANRDREDMHNKIIELGNKRESQRNMNYKLRKENKNLKELLDITVQTKNEKIRNLLEELEYYKKQCGED